MFDNIIKEGSLSKYGLLRAIRIAQASESEATHLYEQIREATTDEVVKKTMTHIIADESRHSGELMGLIHYLFPDEQVEYEKGMKEFVEVVGKVEVEA